SFWARLKGEGMAAYGAIVWASLLCLRRDSPRYSKEEAKLNVHYTMQLCSKNIGGNLRLRILKVFLMGIFTATTVFGEDAEAGAAKNAEGAGERSKGVAKEGEIYMIP